MNRLIAEAQITKIDDILFGHLLWRMSQFLSKLTEGMIRLGQPGLTPITRDLVYQQICLRRIAHIEIPLDLITEVAGMSANSVQAMVGHRDDRRQHFTLAA